MRGGLGPSSALLPWVGLPGPDPGFLSFHDERNQRRARGCRPWTLLRGTFRSPCGSRNPLDRVSTTHPAGFATLSGWANRSFFLPKLHRGSHPLLSIRGAAGGCVACVLPGVAPLSGGSGNAAGGMIMPPQGGPGVPPWRIFGDFLFEKKVTRGGGAERPPHGGCGGRRPPLRGAQRGGQHLWCTPSHRGPQGPPPPAKSKLRQNMKKGEGISRFSYPKKLLTN